MSTKQPLGRVSVPLDMIAEVRELAKFEHATLPQVALLTGQGVASTQHLPIEQAKCGSSQGKGR